MHEGEQDIPRAEALRFARAGGSLRRARILQTTGSTATFRVFRDYPLAAAATTGAVAAGAAAAAAPLSRLASAPAPGGGLEKSGSAGRGGGVWVLEVGGGKFELAGLMPDKSRQQGLVFSTKGGGDIEASCDDKEAYRMWLGVAAAVCPAAVGGGGSGGGDDNLE